MLFIVDTTLPVKAKINLEKYGEIIDFYTEGITYESVSNHPDIFFCRTDDKIICAPNTPDEFKNKVSECIELVEGVNYVDNFYPNSAHYNAVSTGDLIIHNSFITDPVITDLNEGRQKIHVSQGYTRCSLLPLKNDYFITSDKGICKKLKSLSKKVLYVEPEDIFLRSAKHGFFGGVCGVHENKLFIAGSLNKYNEGDKVKQFAENLEYEIIELCETPLYDCGSILIL